MNFVPQKAPMEGKTQRMVKDSLKKNWSSFQISVPRTNAVLQIGLFNLSLRSVKFHYFKWSLSFLDFIINQDYITIYVR